MQASSGPCWACHSPPATRAYTSQSDQQNLNESTKQHTYLRFLGIREATSGDSMDSTPTLMKTDPVPWQETACSAAFPVNNTTFSPVKSEPNEPFIPVESLRETQSENDALLRRAMSFRLNAGDIAKVGSYVIYNDKQAIKVRD